MGNSKDKIQVSFGHNSEAVTGSYTLIQYNKDCNILVDFGMIQENVSLLQEYQLNSKRPNFKPKKINYVFLTHMHIDHCGLIPLLYKWGCEAPIIIPSGSKEVLRAMLRDSANICSRDAKDLTRKLKKEYTPLFLDEDVDRAMNYVQEFDVGVKQNLLDREDVQCQLNYNGHIFKSVHITFWIKNKKIIITGDLGNLTFKQKFTEDFTPFESCNLLIGESTYADDKRIVKSKDREKDLEKIKTYINTFCIQQKGRALIPTFAFGRSPTMLATLYDLFHDDADFNIPIIYASPLGVKLINIFKEQLSNKKDREYLDQVLQWKNIKILNSFDELENEFKDKQPKIFCLPSGMMSSGYSCCAATQILPHSNDLIIFCGYSSEGTLSRKIKDKETKTISIDGKSIRANCQVTSLKSFSSHAQYQDLFKLYTDTNINVDKIVLVHGNYNDKLVFAKKINDENQKNGRSTKTIAATKSYVVSL